MTGGATLSVSLTLSPSHPFLHPAGACSPGRAPCARLMGRPPARLAQMPSHCAHVHARESPKGEKDLFALHSHADRGLAGHRRAATSPLRLRVQSPCAETSLSLRRLDWVPTPRGRASAGHPPTRIGVFPFPEFAAAKGGEKGKWGEGRRSGEEESAPVTPPVRQDRRPLALTESRTSHRGEGRRSSTVGEKPGQSKDQSAAVNIYAAPLSTPSRARLHRRPDVSAPRPSSSSLPPRMLSCVGPATLRRAVGKLDLPVCWPSSRRTAAPRRVIALGLFMLPSSSSPCDVPL
jgi:hypothetical protein